MCIPAGFMDVCSHVGTVHFYFYFYFFTDRGGCWILQNTGEEFSPEQVTISGNPGLSGLAWRPGADTLHILACLHTLHAYR